MENFKPVIEELEKRQKEPQSKTVDRALSDLIKLLKALDLRGISPREIDEHLKELKRILNGPLKARYISGVYHAIKRQIHKDHKLVTPGYYRNLWMVLGMTVFGMFIGNILFAITGNAVYISMGLPMGLPLGIALGMYLDKKAMEEGKVLVFE